MNVLNRVFARVLFFPRDGRLDPQTLHGTAIYANQLGWCQGGQCIHIWQSHGVSGDHSLGVSTSGEWRRKSAVGENKRRTF